MKHFQKRCMSFSSRFCAPARTQVVAEPPVSEFQATSACNLMSWPYPIVGIGLAYVALLIFDIFIFILTVYRIYKTSSLLRFSLVTRRNIVDTIFCDGKTFVASVLSALNQPNAGAIYFGWGCQRFREWSDFDPHCSRAMALSNIPTILTYYVSGQVYAEDIIKCLQPVSVWFSEHTISHLWLFSWRLARLGSEAVFLHSLAGEWLMR